MNPTAHTTEGEILNQAIDRFAAETGLHLKVIAKEQPIGNGRRIDALVDIRIGDQTHTYAIEVTRHLTTATLGLAVERLKGTPYPGILIAEYVNPNIAQRLKDMNIAFLDLAGNAYLHEKPLLIFIKGNRRATTPQDTKNLKPTRAFQTTGLKVIFGLLLKPDLLQQTYREIAKATDVALGTVGWVLNDLREHGYLYEDENKGRRLVQKTKIIEQWVAAYPEKLRPKLGIGKYRAGQPQWWKGAKLTRFDAQWGGEVAAAKLTNYLVPELTVIYTKTLPTRLLAENKMTRDPKGNVEILKRFWDPDLLGDNEMEKDTPGDTTHPFLVYADLMATADPRNIETAGMIRKKYIDGHLE